MPKKIDHVINPPPPPPTNGEKEILALLERYGKKGDALTFDEIVSMLDSMPFAGLAKSEGPGDFMLAAVAAIVMQSLKGTEVERMSQYKRDFSSLVAKHLITLKDGYYWFGPDATAA
jgi:hypothetical protein